MDFFINKNSTLPVLKLELIQNGRDDFYKFYEKVQNANIFFTMYDVITGMKKIAKKPANLEQILPENCVGEEYYITYQFSEKETSVGGRFVGKFTIDFLDGSGTLIVPIQEELFINIVVDTVRK